MAVADILADVGSVITSVVNTIGGNPLLAAFLGLGLIGAGAYTFRKLRGSAD